jgi:hypothetical protein
MDKVVVAALLLSACFVAYVLMVFALYLGIVTASSLLEMAGLIAGSVATFGGMYYLERRSRDSQENR